MKKRRLTTGGFKGPYNSHSWSFTCKKSAVTKHLQAKTEKKKTKSLPNSFSSQRITTGKDSDDTDLLDNKHCPQLNPTGKAAALPAKTEWGATSPCLRLK